MKLQIANPSDTYNHMVKPKINDLIHRLMAPVAPVEPTVACGEVYRLFAEDRSVQSIAVVSGDAPIGLVNRFALIDRFSRRFFREIYERRPITALMEKSPLIVDCGIGLDDLSSIIADEEEKYLFEGFIITQEGRYLGIGTGHRLIKEVTERKQAQLYHLAHHDTLTGLPNRLLFFDRLSQALTQSDRSSKSLGVLFVDLDHFKKVNDTYGHPVGDLLLKEVAQWLQLCLREGDTVARQGGDEFTVILTDLSDPQDLERVCQKILGVFAMPFKISGHDISITCSIGASLFPRDGDEMDPLIQKADTAVYLAKQNRNCYRIYEGQGIERAN